MGHRATWVTEEIHHASLVGAEKPPLRLKRSEDEEKKQSLKFWNNKCKPTKTKQGLPLFVEFQRNTTDS